MNNQNTTSPREYQWKVVRKSDMTFAFSRHYKYNPAKTKRNWFVKKYQIPVEEFAIVKMAPPNRPLKYPSEREVKKWL